MNIDLIWQIYMANKVVLNSIMYAHNQPLRSRTFPFDTIDTPSRRAGAAKCERKKRAEAVTGARCHFFIVQYFPSLLAYRFFLTVFLFLLIKQLLKCSDPGEWREDWADKIPFSVYVTHKSEKRESLASKSLVLDVEGGGGLVVMSEFSEKLIFHFFFQLKLHADTFCIYVLLVYKLNFVQVA